MDITNASLYEVTYRVHGRRKAHTAIRFGVAAGVIEGADVLSVRYLGEGTEPTPAPPKSGKRGGRKATFMDELMAEHIQLPGAPQVIVTRGWAVQWLSRLGYPAQGGFASVDYMVFGRRDVDAPLTDLTASHMVEMIALMESHAS